ncbi:MAG: AtuA-related protein [Desulfurispora sp.]|uniref:AtuA-related protein n=1 Tax=Desulfurispora sp. TaxID=3014275 RepID=UPI004049F905
MPRVLLAELAHARSGDKGNTVNIGLFPYREEDYQLIKEQVTAERVREHFRGLVEGEVVRYEVPNIRAFNFVLRGALGGGASRSLRSDNLGKCFGANLLRLYVEKD